MLIGEIITENEVFTMPTPRLGEKVVLNIDILNVQGTSPTVTIEFQHRDRSGGADFATIAGETITTSAGATGLQTRELTVADNSLKEELRLRFTMGGSGGPLARVFVYPAVWQG